MDTFTLPTSASALPPSPVSSPLIDTDKAKKVPIKPQKKQPTTLDKSLSKADGVAKPKQSKSRDGCATCKQKRLKCDERHPFCQQCERRKVPCGGYNKEFKWRHRCGQSTSTTKTIPPTKPRDTTVSSWPTTEDPSASTATPSTPPAKHPRETVFGPEGSDVMGDDIVSGLATPPTNCACCSRPSVAPDIRGPLQTSSTLSHAIHDGSVDYNDHGPCHKYSHHDLAPYVGTEIKNTFLDGGSRLPSSQGQPIALSPDIERYPPDVDFGGVIVNSYHAGQTAHNPITYDKDALPHFENDLRDDRVEEIIRPEAVANDNRLICLPPSSCSVPSGRPVNWPSKVDMYSYPKMSNRSPEMLLMEFDQQTCGILSVKDGPTENPWRTTIWPLAQDSPALYHAIISMTLFHTSRNRHKMQYEGLVHVKQSVKHLASGIENGTIRVDAALATTLALAFSDSWDRHISTGIAHLQGARAMIRHALANARSHTLTAHETKRLRFLCNTWVYMDVIARLTSVDADDSTDFEWALDVSIGPMEKQQQIDPLMGCASTLFPLIGRVANLVRRVRKTPQISINNLSQANDLKTAVESWEAPDCFAAPEDQTSDIQHSLDTAEAYRWATLLYLHQAVPEIPSISSEELARKVIVVREVWNRRDADEDEKNLRSRSNGHSAHAPSIRERLPRGFGADEVGFSSDRSSVQGTRMAHDMPPNCLRRRSSESIEDLDYEKTVRGRSHWVGVMKDWQWEVLLG
ncbi:MAG: hypothetical protein Q9168_002322 [Polycauliona sp. 1 TL-2023]